MNGFFKLPYILPCVLSEGFKEQIMTIKNDLSSLKVGDKVFSIFHGEDVIRAVYSEDNPSTYKIETNEDSYTLDGKNENVNKHPSLFLSAKHASEYFASIKEKKQIHVKYYVHDYLHKGVLHRVDRDSSELEMSDGEIYLGCTEINKTYEIEE
jgi:hypothetical protein